MTTKNPKPSTATSASNVVPLRESVPPTIEPEEGWTKTTTEGEHLVAEHGEGDRRLVQISTVFRWAMSRSDAPTSIALEQALALVAGIPDGALYIVAEGWPTQFIEGQAVPAFKAYEPVCIPNWHQQTVYPLDERGRLLPLGSQSPRRASSPPPYGHGKPGLMGLMREVWVNEQGGDIEKGAMFSSRDGAHEYLCRLAVPFPVAHRLWGWGKVTAPAVDAVGKADDTAPAIPTTWPELVPYHKANPGHTWTVGLKNIVSNEKIRRTNALHKGVAKAMAAELYVTVSLLNQLIAKKDEIGSRGKTANRRTGTR